MAHTPASSRLKPVPLNARGQSVGPASAGKRPAQTPQFRGVTSDAFPAKAGPTKCTQSHRELGPRAVVIFGPLLLRYQLLFEPRDLLGHSHR
ncbi:hypothetical protein FX982_02332 [Pseudomonas graminis]|uniref:Uncharacterized protein n=1 Tax=Pseudomonas graminis TaxID=158627 RepID=A0A6M8MNS9_9PSED|nr:hypothetical protein FX982_02332 [Pseudomonas graminis]